MEWIARRPFLLFAPDGLYVWRHGLRNWLAERRVDEWFIDCKPLFQGADSITSGWVVATLLREVCLNSPGVGL